MAEAAVVQIAEAVRDALRANIASFSRRFDASVAYLPDLQRAKAGELTITIVPRGDSLQLATRTTTRHEYSVLIDVRQAIDPTSVSSVNILAKVVEEITDFLRKRTMATADWLSASADPLYDAEEMYQGHMFVSQIEATYLLQRAI